MIKKRPTNAREAAAFTLFAMAEDGAWSDGALHHFLERARLDARDAALAARLAYGTLQNRSMCDFYLSKYSKIRLNKIAPRVLDVLRMTVYQLTMLDRIPAHAAVGESINLIRKYCHADPRTVGFANGVLRTIARDAEAGKLPHPDCPDKESYYALRYSHPEWFIRCLSEQFGQKEAEHIAAANNETAPLSVRINRLKITRDEAAERLAADGFSITPHETMDNILLCSGGDIAAHPLFLEGAITVQDAASAACVDVLNPQPGAKTLDCCAAPGGKSFYIAERMENTGEVVSCDVYEHKLEIIRTGAARLGLTNIQARLADGRVHQEELNGWADYVLCDAPCSGLGILRKKPEIRFKTDEELAGLPAIQSAILENCCSYVKPGGTLVYSTCTVLRRENEDVMHGFLEQHPEFALEPFTHPVCGETEGMITLLPHRHQTDGFFIAKLRRTQ
ncbi:MAG: 16S rRNA (cytosine(967)-C(5))-methyltransferase RsmB [Butyricicoccus sp.]